jgi:predicted nucleotidyltransferase
MAIRNTASNRVETASVAAASRVHERVHVPEGQLAAFCRQYHIKSLSLFGSVLPDDFRPDSDIDVLVEFQPAKTPGLFTIAEMERQLSVLFDDRKVPAHSQ